MYPRYLLSLLLLALSMVSYAQAQVFQSPPAAQIASWAEQLREAKALLKQVERSKDNLIALPAYLRDSSALEERMDSLSRQHLDSLVLKRVEDSLRRELSHYGLSLARLEEEKQQLQTRINQLKDKAIPLPWLKRLQEAKQLAQQVSEGREKLVRYPKMLQDSASLLSALDSLSGVGLDSASLAQSKDSLLQAYSARKLAEKVQQEAEQRLSRELQGAHAASAQSLLPDEALALLKESEALLEPGVLGSAAIAAGNQLPGKLFSGSQAKLREAWMGMDKYKGRFEKVESVQEMPKGYFKLNALKGKPWPEHLVLGTLWHFSKQDRFNVDLTPTLAWRFTDLLSVGAGYQYRLGVDIGARPWVSTAEGVHGYTLFLDHQIRKGFFGRLQYDKLNAPVTHLNQDLQVTDHTREWVPGFSVGLGKTFGLWGALQGYALTQYNVLHENRRSPYLSPLQVKLGFYLEGQHLFGKRKQTSPN